MKSLKTILEVYLNTTSFRSSKILLLKLGSHPGSLVCKAIIVSLEPLLKAIKDDLYLILDT